MATVASMRSNLNQMIFHLSKGDLNLCNNEKFPKFQAFYDDFSKRVRNAAKGKFQKKKKFFFKVSLCKPIHEIL